MDEVAIYNLALTGAGTRASVASVDEGSPEANLCKLWYKPVRDQLFRAAPWPSLKGIQRLALKAQRDDDEQWVATDPQPGWTYSYLQPSDMVRPRYLASLNRFDLGLSSTNERVLFANDEQAILTYTKSVDLISLWDADLQLAVAAALAAHICRRLTGNLQDMNVQFQLAKQKIDIARENAANETNFQLEAAPSWLVARGYAGLAPSTPYIYPNADVVVSGIGNLT